MTNSTWKTSTAPRHIERPFSDEQRSIFKNDGDSAGGWAIVLLITSATAYSVVTKSIDGAERIIADNGAVETVRSGAVGSIVGVSIFFVAVIAAVIGVVRAGFQPRIRGAYSVSIFALMAWWAVSSSVNWYNDRIDTEQLVYVTLGTVLAYGVAASPPTLITVRRLNLIRDGTTMLMLMFSFFDPLTSQLPCRTDKCGIFGSMFLGFMFTENAAASIVLLLLPAAIVVRSTTYLAGTSALTLLFLLSTGSRTSITSFAVVLVFVIFFRNRFSGRPPRSVSWVWRSVGLAMMGASSYAFLTYSSDELTGRGRIFAALRAQMDNYTAIFGTGPDAMEDIYRQGWLRHFEAVGEHSQVAHLLVNSGVIGLALFVIAVSAVAIDRNPKTASQIAALAFIIGASIQFVTEPGWTLTSRSSQLGLMLLSMGLYSISVQSPATKSVNTTSDDDAQALYRESCQSRSRREMSH